MGSNHLSLARKSRFLSRKANCGTERGSQKGCFVCGTDGSNPSPSSGESATNRFRGSISNRQSTPRPVPPEIEWFNNITNPGTKRIYKIAVGDFMRFTGILRPDEFRIVTRAHIIAWRDDLERRGLKRPTRRNRLAALSSLFEYLCDSNAITA
jgi:hypothetical protein